LIAAQLGRGSSEQRAKKPFAINKGAPAGATETVAAWLQKLIVPTSLPAGLFPVVVPDLPKPKNQLNIITHVQGVRSLQEIDMAKRRGDGITFEELIRWRAVFERK